MLAVCAAGWVAWVEFDGYSLALMGSQLAFLATALGINVSGGCSFVWGCFQMFQQLNMMCSTSPSRDCCAVSVPILWSRSAVQLRAPQRAV
jgi:hypothetical protein